MTIACREHAVQFVMRSAQRAAETRVANRAQHRWTQARGFIIGKRFDRSICKRVERRRLLRAADGNQRHQRVAHAQFVKQLFAATVVERRTNNDDVDRFFGQMHERITSRHCNGGVE